MSRSVMTTAGSGATSAITASIIWRDSLARTSRSGSWVTASSESHHPDHRPDCAKHALSKAGSSGPSDENGTLRASRPPLVIALFMTIRKIHVLSDDRPSNRSRPRITPSQASWTTSSAASFVATYAMATRTIEE